MELKLINQVEKEFTVGDVHFKCNMSTPFLQAKVLKEIEGLSAEDMTKQVETVEFLFNEISKEVKYKEVVYTGSKFFNMINFLDAGSQTFIADVITQFMSAVLLTEEERKK